MTSTAPGFGSAAFDAVVRGTIALHRLIANGEGEGAQADAIRDALDTPFASLSASEAERVRLLSEDLYSLHESEGRLPKEPNPQVMKAFQAIYEARSREEWDNALTLLRRWQAYLPSALVSYLRGTLWARAGRYDVAAEFHGHAARLEPGDEFPVMHLNALAKFDMIEAERRAEEVLAQRADYSASSVIQAVRVVLAAQHSRSPEETRQAEVRLIPLIREAMERLEQDGKTDSEYYAIAALLLGAAHEHDGDTRQAYQYYSLALRVAPTNADILTQRGILMYGVGPGAAMDLEQATKHGAKSAWPYFFLAHHYLSTNRYEDCRKMCERAMEFPTTDRMRRELIEWLAIAEAELDFPADRVRRRFEEAIRLDPENDRAKKNLTTFETRTTQRLTHSSTWSWSSTATVRAFGQAEHHPDFQLAG